jgi:hypothetical protein
LLHQLLLLLLDCHLLQLVLLSLLLLVLPALPVSSPVLPLLLCPAEGHAEQQGGLHAHNQHCNSYPCDLLAPYECFKAHQQN